MKTLTFFIQNSDVSNYQIASSVGMQNVGKILNKMLK